MIRMTSETLDRPALVLAPAKHSGFTVTQLVPFASYPEVLFAGSLEDCLSFQRSLFDVPRVLIAKDCDCPAGAVCKTPECARLRAAEMTAA